MFKLTKKVKDMRIQLLTKGVLLLIVAIVNTACAKKNWACTCTLNGGKYGEIIENVTKVNANKGCVDFGKSLGQQYGTTDYKCVVK